MRYAPGRNETAEKQLPGYLLHADDHPRERDVERLYEPQQGGERGVAEPAFDPTPRRFQTACLSPMHYK